MKFLRISFVILAALILAYCSDDESNPIVPDQSPTISGVSPSSFARGQQQQDLTITGTNLTGVTVVGLGDGTTVHSASATSSTSISVKFSVQRQAVPGTRNVSVTTPRGTAVANAAFRIEGDAPEANFSVSPNTIFDVTDVEFDGSLSSDADGTIRQYSWDFGDGKRATGMKVTHKFAKGDYDVRLTVTDNDNHSSGRTKTVKVEEFREQLCTSPSKNNGLLYGTVIDVEPGNNAIVVLDKTNANCGNAFYYCGDMRDGEVDLDFYGIIHEMADRGNHTFRVKNSCPYKWPPAKGKRVFLFYKSCDINFCP